MARIKPLVLLPDILMPLLKSHGMETRLLEFSLQVHWEKIVGEHIGRHTWPDSIRHHKLFLVAESSVWLQQLVFLKAELLTKINATAGTQLIEDIVLRVGSVGRDAQPGKDAAVPEVLDGPVSPGLIVEVEASVQSIANAELRERLRGLLLKSASMMSREGPFETAPVHRASVRPA
jgi:hypothetical protein